MNVNEVSAYEVDIEGVYKLIQQLMNEAEYLIKNYGDRGGCYPSSP